MGGWEGEEEESSYLVRPELEELVAPPEEGLPASLPHSSVEIMRPLRQAWSGRADLTTSRAISLAKALSRATTYSGFESSSRPRGKDEEGASIGRPFGWALLVANK